jgi:hypothetical protein
MKLSRLPRFVAALITIFSLLFSQFAVASYVCPGVATAPGAATVAMQPSASGQLTACPGMDAKHPCLCHSHCEKGYQSLDTPAWPQVAPFLAAELSFVLHDVAMVQAAVALPIVPVLLRPTGAPPLTIRHCCFRI